VTDTLQARRKLYGKLTRLIVAVEADVAYGVGPRLFQEARDADSLLRACEAIERAQTPEEHSTATQWLLGLLTEEPLRRAGG
jgi:hypothetical protein